MTDPTIEYRQDVALDPVDVARLFEASGIARPTKDLPRIAKMFAAPGLVISAWAQNKLVGLSRSLTDHAYCCYLSDLAVDRAYQARGIGRELVRRTRAALSDEVTLLLLAAPEAIDYYPKLGFDLATNAYVIRRSR